MQNISLAGVLPIHTGRGVEAERRKADERGGQNLTAQYINHTEVVPPVAAVNVPQVNIQPEQTMEVTNPEVGMAQVTMPVVDVPALQQYVDESKSVEHSITDTVVLVTTQHVEYEHSLKLDWKTLPEPVMFVFIAKDGTIYGTTHEPEPDYDNDDWNMVEGQKMIIGKIGADIKRTTLLTLTERVEEEPEVVESVLMDVNPDVTLATDEPQEKPYYAEWGKKRRQRERARLRSQGKPVPAGL